MGYRYDATRRFGAYHRKDDTQLGEALESALTKLREDGTLAELAAKYELPEEGPALGAGPG